MERPDYVIVFEKLEEVLRLQERDTSARPDAVLHGVLDEVEELSRFVADLNEERMNSYTTG